MTHLTDQPDVIHNEDVLLIRLVVTAIDHPQYLTMLNAQLTQAESAGWTSLVNAIRGILAGERKLENLGVLDNEDLHIVNSILITLKDSVRSSEGTRTTSSQEPSSQFEAVGNNYLRSVREQYESYPYPKRDPFDEKKNLFVTTTEHLGKISHYCYRGMRDLREGGRFLVAGGGTGDAAIYLAEQLRDTNGEIVYVDLSSRSMDIARKRAEVRGLKNISWHQNSLLELPNLNLGTFDYINCCGVLHHLANPSQGLQALSRVLKEDGCMAIMVYAQYGRTAIYQIQELMRRINVGEQDFQQCISNTRGVLADLPEGNWYKRDEFRWHETLQDFGDIEIFDLFLHSQDRAYTVPEAYQLALENELHLIAFTGFAGQKQNYEFSRYFKNQDITKRISNMPIAQQQAIAELANGCIKTHTFYLSRTDNTLANIDNLDLVPYYAFKFVPCETLYSDLSRTPGKPVSIRIGNGVEPILIPQSQYTRFIFRYINGKYSVREILAHAYDDAKMAGMAPSDKELSSELQKIIDSFIAYELMFLRHYTVKPYKSDYELFEEGIQE